MSPTEQFPEDESAEDAGDVSGDIPEPERWTGDPASSDRAIEWLFERWGSIRPCPYCGTQRWTVGPFLTFDYDTFNEGEILSLKSPPLVPVTCTNCGNTALIHPNPPQVGADEETAEDEQP